MRFFHVKYVHIIQNVLMKTKKYIYRKGFLIMRDNSRKVSPLEINGAKIVLRRNFSGDVIVTKSGSWNQEGKRTFNIELDQELADMLATDLWSVKQYENQDGDVTLFLPIEIKFNTYDKYDKATAEELKEKFNPKVYIVTDQHKVLLDEYSLKLLDKARIRYVNLRINPYPWVIGSKVGTKAYLDKMYVVIEPGDDTVVKEDPLDAEFANVPLGELDEF